MFSVTIKTLTLWQYSYFSRVFFFEHRKLVHASVNPKYVFSVHKGLGFYLGGTNSCRVVWFQKPRTPPLSLPHSKICFPHLFANLGHSFNRGQNFHFIIRNMTEETPLPGRSKHSCPGYFMGCQISLGFGCSPEHSENLSTVLLSSLCHHLLDV